MGDVSSSNFSRAAPGPGWLVNNINKVRKDDKGVCADEAFMMSWGRQSTVNQQIKVKHRRQK